MIDPARLTTLWALGDLTFHPTQLSHAAFSDIVFYARSRCIPLADAAVMALGSFSGSIGWFEPATPELAEEAEELERRIHRPWKRRKRKRGPK